MRRTPVLLAAAVLALAAPARAHFIWLHVLERPLAEVEVLFGDGVYEDSDANLVRYVEGLEAWVPGGEPLELDAHPWGLSGALAGGTDLVAARRDMGVFDRPGPGSEVKLDYYAKGAADLAAAGRRAGTRAELLLEPRGDALAVTVLFDGEPAPGAQVFVDSPTTTADVETETGAEGRALLERPRSGILSIRARIEVPEPGEHEGQPFTAEHHWATLTVANVREDGLPEQPEPAAWLRLEAVTDAEARLPEGLAGLAGTLRYEVAGASRRGEFSVAGGEVRQCELPGASAEELAWLRRELLDLVGRRSAVDFETSAGRHTVRMDEREGHPLGRALRVDDRRGTVHRVVESRRVSTEWTEGGRRHVEVVLERTETQDGRFLPTHTVRSLFDPDTGELLATETRRDAYESVEDAPLPASRLVITASDAGVRAVHLELRNHELVRWEDLPDEAGAAGTR